MKIGEFGEFPWIRRLAGTCTDPLTPGLCGIGDDCAVIPSTDGPGTLVTTDLLIEHVHFRTDWTAATDLGAKALAVNLSDIAAMGGTPRWVFVSMGLPPETEVAWTDAFFRGFHELATQTRVSLLGGDTTRSPGPIIVNIAVLGDAPLDCIKYRHTALPGDVLLVTGTLGDSAAGLKLLQISPARKLPEEARLVRRHLRPRPHLEEGAWLGARNEVHAMMDVSDGIDSDLRRILSRSHAGARIDLDRLPVSPGLRRVADRYGWRSDELAAAGGEDYTLLLSADPRMADSLQKSFSRNFGRSLFRIGVITPEENQLEYRRRGIVCRLEQRGFEHFAPPAEPPG